VGVPVPVDVPVRAGATRIAFMAPRGARGVSFHMPRFSLMLQRALIASLLVLPVALTAQTSDTPPARTAPVWPVPGPPPLPGSLLPAKRIVAYYGNPLSTRMGILGELPVDQMLTRLDGEVSAWRRADPATPVQPALHLIAMVAQADRGRDGKYRAKMADTLIERVYGWTKRRDAVMFLDLQVGLSTIQAEAPRFESFLSRPDVHLGIDPEFAMHDGAIPGKRVGWYDADDINWVIDYLAELVTRHNLPPKVLVVHRFTQRMVRNADRIKRDPRVQVVIHMDGWGAPRLKRDTYDAYITREPVQFTGFKIFYKNDTRRGSSLMTPADLLTLTPVPLYIQYQ
jgi:hypothetical protein